MSPDSSLVGASPGRSDLLAPVRAIIAQVLMVAEADVRAALRHHGPHHGVRDVQAAADFRPVLAGKGSFPFYLEYALIAQQH